MFIKEVEKIEEIIPRTKVIPIKEDKELLPQKPLSKPTGKYTNLIGFEGDVFDKVTLYAQNINIFATDGSNRSIPFTFDIVDKNVDIVLYGYSEEDSIPTVEDVKSDLVSKPNFIVILSKYIVYR